MSGDPWFTVPCLNRTCPGVEEHRVRWCGCVYAVCDACALLIVDRWIPVEWLLPPGAVGCAICRLIGHPQGLPCKA